MGSYSKPRWGMVTAKPTWGHCPLNLLYDSEEQQHFEQCCKNVSSNRLISPESAWFNRLESVRKVPGVPSRLFYHHISSGSSTFLAWDGLRFPICLLTRLLSVTVFCCSREINWESALCLEILCKERNVSQLHFSWVTFLLWAWQTSPCITEPGFWLLVLNLNPSPATILYSKVP